MLENLLGDFNGMSEKMVEHLQSITIEESYQGITITGNAARVVEDIEIAEDLLGKEKKEELQDLLTIAMNNFLLKVSQEEGAASKKMISDMLPPGMSGLFG